MALLRQRSRLVALSPAWRGALWRWRHAFLAVALLTSVLLLAEVLAPPPARPAVVVLARDVPAGHDLAAADLTLGDAAAPASSFAAAGDVVGRRLAVGLPAGTVVSAEMLLGPGLADGAPPGHLVLPVAVADPGSVALATSGRVVTLLGVGPDGSSAVQVPDVLVLSVLEESESSGLISTAERSTTLIVAVPRRLATVVVDASAQGPLRVAVPTAFP